MQHRVDQTHAHLYVRVGVGRQWFPRIKLPYNQNQHPHETKNVKNVIILLLKGMVLL